MKGKSYVITLRETWKKHLMESDSEPFYVSLKSIHSLAFLACRLLLAQLPHLLFPRQTSARLFLCSFLTLAALCEACRILVPQPGIEPIPPALEGRVLTTDRWGSPALFL